MVGKKNLQCMLEKTKILCLSSIDKRKSRKNSIILTKINDEVCMSMISQTKRDIDVVDLLSTLYIVRMQ